jgi:hypothetical protein
MSGRGAGSGVAARPPAHAWVARRGRPCRPRPGVEAATPARSVSATIPQRSSASGQVGGAPAWPSSHLAQPRRDHLALPQLRARIRHHRLVAGMDWRRPLGAGAADAPRGAITNRAESAAIIDPAQPSASPVPAQTGVASPLRDEAPAPRPRRPCPGGAATARPAARGQAGRRRRCGWRSRAGRGSAPSHARPPASPAAKPAARGLDRAGGPAQQAGHVRRGARQPHPL